MLIIIEGKSPKPVYTYTSKTEILKSGMHQNLWGLDTGDAEAKIREELNDKRIE
jgi:aldehyde:ferredoxin oxidoreductase